MSIWYLDVILIICRWLKAFSLVHFALNFLIPPWLNHLAQKNEFQKSQMTWFSVLERNSAQWENVFFDTVWNSPHFFPCSFSLQVQQPKLKIRCKTDCFPHNYNWTIFNWRYIHIFCLVTQSTTLGGTMLHAFRRFNQIDLQKSQKIPHLIKFWLLNV